MHNDIEKILITEEEIAAKVKEFGKRISKDYEGKDLILIAVLKGSVVFIADIMRQITIPFSIDFMAVSSYGNESSSSGTVKINMDLKQDIKGKDVLIIEDIIDSGLTLTYLTKFLYSRKPNSIKICAILNKKECHKAEIKTDYLGFDIPSDFVVGYGLDYAEKYRGLPYVGILKPEVYSK